HTVAAIDEKVVRELLIKEADANIIVFENGIFSEKHTRIIDKNITIKSLALALKENPETVEKYFSKSVRYKNSLLDLNTAIAVQGVFIHVDKGQEVTHPVIVYYLSHSHTAIATNIRNLIIAE